MQMSDMLNYAHRVAPGVIICKDDGFLAGWKLNGLDNESVDPDELHATLERVARGVSELQEGDALWLTLWRALAPTAKLSQTDVDHLEPAVALVVSENAEIETDGEIYENSIHVVYRCALEDDFPTMEQRLEAFERRREVVQNILGSVFELTRLGTHKVQTESGGSFETDELADLVATMAAGRPIQQRLSRQQDIYLDAALAADYEQPGFQEVPRLDGQEAAFISIESWPQDYDLDALAALETLDFDYRWTVRYIVQSQTRTRAAVTALRRRWRQAGSNLLGNILGAQSQDRDLHADMMANSLDGVSVDLGRGLRFGELTSTITVLAGDGEDPARDLRRKIAAVDQVLMANGFRGRRERVNAREAYLGSLPGHMAMQARSSTMSAFNFATLIPYRSFWNGERYCPCDRFPPKSPPLMLAHSARGELFQFNLHVKDVGHTIVAGPTGAGKSVLLGAIAAHFLKYENAQVFYFDKHCSSRHLCNAVGGSFIEFGAGEGRGLAPLGNIQEVGQEWAEKWVRMIPRLADKDASPKDGDELVEAVRNLSDTGGGSLTDIRDFVLGKDAGTAVERFLGSEGRPAILDGKIDTLEWKPLTVFEAEELFQYDEATSLLALDYIFRRCEQRFDGRPTLVVFDEAAAFLRHALFRTQIAEWLREVRKKNVSIVMATQQVSDFVNSGIGASFENVHSYVFLPNARAASKKTADAYREFNLTDRQIEVISMLEPKRDYYVMKPQGSRVMNFRFGAASLSLFAKTDKTASDRAKRLAAERPDYWIEDLQHDAAS
ncbi:hypothetical protein [Yoonia sp. R2-816]|uniref:hypothetical protein n=1 Tax=Yoonia sp. R2-816 TaxID=3342638 RepID=UPI0037269CFF